MKIEGGFGSVELKVHGMLWAGGGCNQYFNLENNNL